MRHHVALTLTLASLAVIACRTEPTPQAAQPPAGGIDRSILPIARPVTPTITTLDARNATAPPPFTVTAPKGAPNVVYILIDDMGFGGPSTFGGAIPMPALALAARRPVLRPAPHRLGPVRVHQRGPAHPPGVRPANRRMAGLRCGKLPRCFAM